MPPLEGRATDYPCSRPLAFSVRNKYNGTYIPDVDEWGGNIHYRGFVHTFNSLVPPSVYGAKHPEYYSEINGRRVIDHSQLCLTNPDVLKIATETVLKWCEESPRAAIISVSQNDWHNYCSGLVRQKETVKVRIPAGVEDGMQLTLRGEGHAAAQGGINGDLLVIVEEQPHAQLKREGQNLFYTRVISVADAMLGCEIQVPALDGPQRIKLEPGTQSGTVQRLRGKGLPSVNGYGMNRGDLYVKILVWIPRKLGRSEREAIEKLRDAFRPDPNREDKTLFEKESQYF